MNDEMKTRLQNHNLLGFRVNPGTIGDFIAFIDEAVGEKRKETVFYHNLHSLYMFFTSKPLRQSYERVTVLADGMPIIWLLKIMRMNAEREQRVTYVDFIWPMLEAARDNGWNVYHVGQEKSVQQNALDLIREKLPGISIDGHDGYFDLTDNCSESQAVIESINAHGTDLLLVGFGAPKQELWVHAHREQIDAAAVFTCGACMEYVAGAVKTPPRWMGKLGLEWSYRLIENPRRFGFRYLIEPILLGFHLARNLLSERSVGPAIHSTDNSENSSVGDHATSVKSQAGN